MVVYRQALVSVASICSQAGRKWIYFWLAINVKTNRNLLTKRSSVPNQLNTYAASLEINYCKFLYLFHFYFMQTFLNLVQRKTSELRNMKFCIEQGLEARVNRVAGKLYRELRFYQYWMRLFKVQTPSLIDTQNLILNNPASKSELIVKEIWYFPFECRRHWSRV